MNGAEIISHQLTDHRSRNIPNQIIIKLFHRTKHETFPAFCFSDMNFSLFSLFNVIKVKLTTCWWKKRKNLFKNSSSGFNLLNFFSFLKFYSKIYIMDKLTSIYELNEMIHNV